MARTFAEEVDRQMRARGLRAFAETVLSEDGAEALRRLEHFRTRRHAGVLCTVGMAGEGYDCPEIAVVAYATNVITAQYIRQVVARAQRVTNWERKALGGPLFPTAIILPDVKELVDQFIGILAPMVHDVPIPAPAAEQPPDRARGSSVAPWSDKQLINVTDPELEVVSAVSTEGTFHADPAVAVTLASALRAQNLPESIWPRVQGVIEAVNRDQPFDRPIEIATGTAVAEPPSPIKRRITSREHHDVYRDRLNQACRWVAGIQGREESKRFRVDTYKQAGIRDLETANPDQLKHACRLALARIQKYCAATAMAVPWWARSGADDQQ